MITMDEIMIWTIWVVAYLYYKITLPMYSMYANASNSIFSYTRVSFYVVRKVQP